MNILNILDILNILNILNISNFDLLIYFENAAQWHTVYLRKNGPWPNDRMKTNLMPRLCLPSSVIEHPPFGSMIFPAKPPCIKKIPSCCLRAFRAGTTLRYFNRLIWTMDLLAR